jgi:ribosome maturation factor RimP
LVTVTLSEGDPVTGRIIESDDGQVTLDVDGTARRIGYAQIGKALVQVELNRPKSNAPGRNDPAGREN